MTTTKKVTSKRTTTTTRETDGGCLSCCMEFATAGGAAIHHDVTGHTTWVNVKLTIEYTGKATGMKRQVNTTATVTPSKWTLANMDAMELFAEMRKLQGKSKTRKRGRPRSVFSNGLRRKKEGRT